MIAFVRRTGLALSIGYVVENHRGTQLLEVGGAVPLRVLTMGGLFFSPQGPISHDLADCCGQAYCRERRGDGRVEKRVELVGGGFGGRSCTTLHK